MGDVSQELFEMVCAERDKAFRDLDLMTRERDVAYRDATWATVAELRRKLKAQHIELARRARRDEELAHYLPAIAARLQAMAAGAALGPSPKSWEDDPEIDWTGIER